MVMMLWEMKETVSGMTPTFPLEQLDGWWAPISRDKNPRERTCLWRKKKSSALDPLSLRSLQDIHLEMLKWQLEDMILGFKRDLWTRDLDLRAISLKLAFEYREMDDITQREARRRTEP